MSTYTIAHDGEDPTLPLCQSCADLQRELAAQTKRADKLEALDKESHDLCCRLAAKIGVERGYSEQMTQERDQWKKRAEDAERERDALKKLLRDDLLKKLYEYESKCLSSAKYQEPLDEALEARLMIDAILAALATPREPAKEPGP